MGMDKEKNLKNIPFSILDLVPVRKYHYIFWSQAPIEASSQGLWDCPMPLPVILHQHICTMHCGCTIHTLKRQIN